ncbi:MAG: hypothetical protein LBE12_15130 [Planctomycetaceae bacterium]|nr:hypothetical protein [Planctomycetaceae bacterium]
MHNRRCSAAQPTVKMPNIAQHNKAPHGARLSATTVIISPLQGFGKGGSSCSGGCASLHRRLCISHP